MERLPAKVEKEFKELLKRYPHLKTRDRLNIIAELEQALQNTKHSIKPD
jgi:hypothetical protein